MADIQPIAADAKKPWQSKTVVFNVLVSMAGILSALGFIPQVQAFLQGNESVVIGVLGAIGVGLRMISSDKISILQ